MPCWVQVNRATTWVVTGGGVGPTGVMVGTSVNVGWAVNEGDSDGSRMKVGDGLGVAVDCTNGGSVGESDAKAIWVGSAGPGGFER